MRIAKELSARAVASLSKRRGLHAVGGVPGLCLQVKEPGRDAAWMFRYMAGKRTNAAGKLVPKVRHMGLGSARTFSLSEARERARAQRQVLESQQDPLAERDAAKNAAALAAKQTKTFEQCATDFIATKRAGWKDDEWTASLRKHVYPVFGNVPVQDVTLRHVIAALEPIWTTTTDTATKVRQRIEAILEYAKTCEYRTGDNPARWKGYLSNMLAKPSKVHKVQHHPAMPYVEVPPFFHALVKREEISAKALAFTILTAARSSEARLATIGEIDFVNAVWNVPGERMKSGKPHRVPLPKEAMDILRSLNLGNDKTALLFPNRNGNAMSDMTLLKFLRQSMGQTAYTVHGFRATFSTWTAECTSYSTDLKERALAHVTDNKVRDAYERTDLFEKRRSLMKDWAAYCIRGTNSSGEVVPSHRAV